MGLTPLCTLAGDTYIWSGSAFDTSDGKSKWVKESWNNCCIENGVVGRGKYIVFKTGTDGHVSVYCVSLETGEDLWEYETNYAQRAETALRSGSYVDQSGLEIVDEDVYFACDDGAHGELTAVDLQNGKVKYKTSEFMNGCASPSLLATDGTFLYFYDGFLYKLKIAR